MADSESLFVAAAPREGLFWGLPSYGYHFCACGGGVGSGSLAPAAGERAGGRTAGEGFSETAACTDFKEEN